jgi:hypothetical protein
MRIAPAVKLTELQREAERLTVPMKDGRRPGLIGL